MHDAFSGSRPTSIRPDQCFSSAPPPLPPVADPRAGTRPERSDTIQDAFGAEFQALERVALPGIVEALLKSPARLVHEITRGRRAKVSTLLMGMTTAALLAYGFIMGTFAGGHQLWAVPLKCVAGFMISAAICFPSLYIFVCLGGCRQSVQEVWSLLWLSLALSSVLLIGFAPVTWIFSQSTETISFMGFLHMLFWLVATGFGIHLLERTFAHLNNRRLLHLRLWMALFVAVSLQMMTTLRPLVGPYEKTLLAGKKFWGAHWVDTLHNR